MHQAQIIDERYSLLEPIGGGGMGSVWLADDRRLHRHVAVKFLNIEYAGDADLRKRFEIEAQAMARISHPFVAEIYDVGSLGDQPYIVMEYVRGQTLTDFIRARAPLAETVALRWLESVARGVAAIHRKDVIHRDLKPNNLLIPDGGEREHLVKIVDFGIARNIGGASITTELGRRFYTPNYASPEQVAGRPLAPASDIYTLGVIFSELLGSTLPPNLYELQGRLSPPVFMLLDKMLRHDAAARPQDGGFLLDLIRHLDTAGNTTRPSPVPALSGSVGSAPDAATVSRLPQIPAPSSPAPKTPTPAERMRQRLDAIRNRPAEELSPAALFVDLFTFVGAALLWLVQGVGHGLAALGRTITLLFRGQEARIPQARQGLRRVTGAASDTLSAALHAAVNGLLVGAIGGAVGGVGGWLFWSLTHWESLRGLGEALFSLNFDRLFTFFLARMAPWALTAGFWGAILAALLGLLVALLGGADSAGMARSPISKILYGFFNAAWAVFRGVFLTYVHMLLAAIPLGLLALSDPAFHLVLLRVDSFTALLEDLCYWAALGSIGWAITLTVDRLFDGALSNTRFGFIPQLALSALLGAVALGSGSYILWLVLSAVGLREALNPGTLLTHIRTDVALQVGLIGGALVAFLRSRRRPVPAAPVLPPSAAPNSPGQKR